MIKHLALLVVVFTLILAVPASADEPGNGIIEGQVVNGTEGGSSVAEQEIILKTYLNNDEVAGTTTITDAEGYFVFDKLSTEPDYGYQITVTFQEAEYNSEWLTFNDSETTKFTKVTVYDSTTSADALRIEMAHTVIYVEPDSLWVEEYLLFVNEADRTYIGWKEVASGEVRETLRFWLPEEVIELQPGIGLMECCIYASEDGFVDSMPVLPGGKEVAYSYRINHGSGTFTLSQKVNYPTTNFDLLVQGEGVKIASDQLITEEPMNINDLLFNHLSGTDLATGDIIVARLSGLSGSNHQGGIIWVVLTLIVLTGGFGLVYVMRRRKLQAVETESSFEQRSQRILAEIAQLDDDFEVGKMEEEVYRKLRAEKKSQLMVLMKKTKERSGK